MTNNSLKRLAELAGRFEKLADGGPATHQQFEGAGKNLGNFDNVAPDLANKINQEEYGDLSTKKDVLGQNKKWINVLEVAVNDLAKKTANKPGLYDVPGDVDTFDKDGGKFDTLHSAVKSIDDALKEIGKFYLKLSQKSKVNLLCKRAYMLLSAKRVWTNVVESVMSFNSKELLKHLYEGDTGYWISIQSTSKSASLREVHKMLKSASANDYELSAREIAKLKSLVKSI